MRDEAEIRGHRRTYIGALPGQIIQGLRRAESRNPVFILDEIDKLGKDFRGDPASALLEVLDPEQNNSFRDHYLDVPFDLSEVLFITTANVLDTIPGPLRDRMEVLELPGYTEEEKLRIARDHLVGQADREPRPARRRRDVRGRGAVGDHPRLHARSRRPQPRARDRRDLPQDRAAAGRRRRPAAVESSRAVVEELLGAPRHLDEEMKDRTKDPGVADRPRLDAGRRRRAVRRGLADGRRQPADAHRPARRRDEGVGADRAVLVPRARDAVRASIRTFYKDSEIHLHVPAGAIPKDGPSAGVTMVTALASALSARPVRSDVAMTGEITLSGRVLPVGGIKEKVLAAKRAGITTVILPRQNEKNIREDLTEELRRGLTVHYVDEMDEVLKLALLPPCVLGRTARGAAAVRRSRGAAIEPGV